MNNSTKPLWVIEFNHSISHISNGLPSFEMYVPKEVFAPHEIADAFTDELLGKMKQYFEFFLNHPEAIPSFPTDIPPNKEDLKKGLGELQKWLLDFQKFLKNPPKDFPTDFPTRFPTDFLE